MLDSENNNGITKRFQLKFPFEKATSCLFEAEQNMLMMQDENHEKMFYTFDGENWAIKKLSVPDKY